jgi:hypothetical protein
MDEDLLHNVFAFAAPKTDDIFWDNMSICQTCFELRGEWTLRGCSQPVLFYQRCLCESAVPEVGNRTHKIGMSARPRNSRFQFMVRVLTEDHEALTRESAPVLMAADGSCAPVAAQAEAHNSPCA